MCVALCGVLPAAASAADSMNAAEPILVGSRHWGSTDELSTQPGEPLTEGSGSACFTQLGESWTFNSTSWYSFLGTGETVVARLDGTLRSAGIAVYKGWSPEEATLQACAGWKPQRSEIHTELGHLYWIQVGVTGEDASPYRLSLFPKTDYGDRSNAFSAPLETAFEIGSWGAPLEDPRPWCPASQYGESGDRSAWARVDVPLFGTLHVSLTPAFGGMKSMILLHSADDRLTRCAFSSSSDEVELSEYLSPGPYWLQFTRAFNVRLDEEGSIEESWLAETDFDVDFDVDGDGHARPSDCDDRNTLVHPGAEEVWDNGVDENCDGADAKFDSDQDFVPDFRDRCPHRPTRGIDSDYDGCPDPGRLQLVAQIRLTLNRGSLHVASLFVRTDPGTRVALTCERGACEKIVKKVHGRQTRFDDTFDPSIPDGAAFVITATKPMYLGLTKRYRVSRQGLRLLREWCTDSDKGGEVVPCD